MIKTYQNLETYLNNCLDNTDAPDFEATIRVADNTTFYKTGNASQFTKEDNEICTNATVTYLFTKKHKDNSKKESSLLLANFVVIIPDLNDTLSITSHQKMTEESFVIWFMGSLSRSFTPASDSFSLAFLDFLKDRLNEFDNGTKLNYLCTVYTKNEKSVYSTF